MSKQHTYEEEVQEILTDTFKQGRDRAHMRQNLVVDGAWIDLCTEQIIESSQQEFIKRIENDPELEDKLIDILFKAAGGVTDMAREELKAVRKAIKEIYE